MSLTDPSLTADGPPVSDESYNLDLPRGRAAFPWDEFQVFATGESQYGGGLPPGGEAAALTVAWRARRGRGFLGLDAMLSSRDVRRSPSVEDGQISDPEGRSRSSAERLGVLLEMCGQGKE